MIIQGRAQDLTYTNINGAISITGTTSPYGLVGAVSLPNTIEGLPVVSIGSRAEGVTTIGLWAFYGCSRLPNVSIPNSVTSIVAGAFSDCASLTNVTIGSGITSTDELVFSECYRLDAFT